MGARIAGLGQWLPSTTRTNEAWPGHFADLARESTTRELVEMDPNTSCLAEEIALKYMASEANDPFLGATERRVAEPGMTAPEAEAAAAREALLEARCTAAEIDVVLSWAAVPERISPPSAPRVADLIGATNAYGVGTDAACASVVTQLEFAAGLIESGRANTVLLTQSHLMTRLFKMIHPASPTVGDAATAVVIKRCEQPSILRAVASSHGDSYDAITWCRGSTNDPPWWQPGGGYYLGSRNVQRARELVRSTVRYAVETIEAALRRNGMKMSDVDVLATMQPRRWIPSAIVQALGASTLAPQTFDRLAHVGGCGVVTNLLEAKRKGKVRPGTRVLLYAQGAGFTRAATIVCW